METPQPTDEALVLLHLLSLNETRRARGQTANLATDAEAWGELTSVGAIDQWGAITAIGREILGEVQPPDHAR